MSASKLPKNDESGFSLMEVLIAAAISIIVVAGATQFMSQMQSLAAVDLNLSRAKLNYLRFRSVMSEILSIRRVMWDNGSREFANEYYSSHRSHGSWQNQGRSHNLNLFLQTSDADYATATQKHIRIGSIINECVPSGQTDFPSIDRLLQGMKNYANLAAAADESLSYFCNLDFDHYLVGSFSSPPRNCAVGETIRAKIEFRPFNDLVRQVYFPDEKIDNKVVVGMVCGYDANLILLTGIRGYKNKDIAKDIVWTHKSFVLDDPSLSSNVTYTIRFPGSPDDAKLSDINQGWVP